MSRVGLKPIPVPAGVQVRIDGRLVHVKGPKGELQNELPAGLVAKLADGRLSLAQDATQAVDVDRLPALHGLHRTRVANMVAGVAQAFTRVLEIEGVGYRAATDGKKLTLSLGFTHPVVVDIPPTMAVEVDKQKQNILTLSCPDRARLGQFAADLRALKPPEPYKGKGVRYQGERIRRKAGKAGKAGAKA